MMLGASAREPDRLPPVSSRQSQAVTGNGPPCGEAPTERGDLIQGSRQKNCRRPSPARCRSLEGGYMRRASAVSHKRCLGTDLHVCVGLPPPCVGGGCISTAVSGAASGDLTSAAGLLLASSTVLISLTISWKWETS